MSIEAMTWALSADVGDPTRKLVLIGWANHAHKDGRNAWASQATIADYVNCSSKTVGRHAKVLLAEGWIREGDQGQVAHLRPDRRPVVYDLAMTETQRLEWKADYEATSEATAESSRGDNLSTRDAGAGGQSVSPSTGHGWTDGGTSGGTPMSDEPKRTLEVPPNPRTAGEPAPATTSPARAGCRRHRAQAANCRGCGTTQRQLDTAAARQAAENARTETAQAFAADRERKATVAVPLPPALKDQARNQIRANQRKAAS